MSQIIGKPTFLLPFSKRIVIFGLATLMCFLIGAVVTSLLAAKQTTPAIRVATMVQDVVIFIAPAIITAVMVTRMPGRFLMIDRKPGFTLTLLGIAILLAFVPAMNALVAWNESLTLPGALSGLEETMRNGEEAAKAMIDKLIGPRDSIGSYVMAVLIVGVMAGLSEELYFRGAMMRVLATGPVNPHVAIWVTALIFSAIHFQFFGFFPRMVLGALFGYLAWWSGSLWVPIAVHTVNNILVVTDDFFSSGQSGVSTLGTEAGSSTAAVWIAVSLVLTAALLWAFVRVARYKGIGS